MTDIATWLKELGLERYEPAFREGEITAAVLPELTEADLKELGLPLGQRRLLLKAIASLPGRLPAAPVPASTTVSREAERRQLTVRLSRAATATTGRGARASTTWPRARRLERGPAGPGVP